MIEQSEVRSTYVQERSLHRRIAYGEAKMDVCNDTSSEFPSKAAHLPLTLLALVGAANAASSNSSRIE
jgi:hypothetical protein